MTAKRLLIALCLLLSLCAVGFAQPADPQPDPAAANVFYGAVPPGGENAPVLVFIHGTSGYAAFFWTLGNDMYSAAYTAGYRTAFISMNADNTPNSAKISENAAMIFSTLPLVLSHYRVNQIIFIGHSKGGLDLQYAMAAYPGILNATQMVFTLATPNQGAALSDWCFGPGKVIARLLNLFNPAVADMRIATVQAMRAAFDPIFRARAIPFYTLSGNVSTGNLITTFTGPILKSITGEDNDGLVTPNESRLDSSFATEMGIVGQNHYRIGSGAVAFPYIQARLPLP